jgi:N-acetylmuramate 1-kinase
MISDARFDALGAWLERVLPAPMESIAPASADASFRRYFRVTLAREIALPDAGPRVGTLIAMDAPPPQEDCRPFVAVARLLATANVHAPAVLAADLARGFLLLSDLGTRTYLAELSEATAPALYRDAIAALVRWQAASRNGVLPRYDEALLARELNLFADWYVAKHLGVPLPDAQRTVLDHAFRQIIANNLSQPCVYVHRDYHSRNLMVVEPRPGFSTSRTQYTVRLPMTWCRCCAMHTSHGTRSISSIGRCATGSMRELPGFRSAPTSPHSGAISNGWACSAT